MTYTMFYQSIGICPKCTKHKLFGDEKACPECRAKYTQYSKNRDREHYNEVHSNWARRVYQERKEQGICTRCGKRKAKQGQYRCELCIAKDLKTRQIRDWHLSRYERGLCRWCDNPVEPGYKVCEYHHQMNINKGQKRICATT